MLQRCDDWIGALVDFPGFVEGEGEGEPYRPVAVVWFEPSERLIVDSELVKPRDALPRAAGLFHLATREPKVGEPRIPRRVRVADPALGAALKGFIGDVEVVVEPTPEIDEVLASMREYFRRRDRKEGGGRLSYLTAGVTTDAIRTFLASAAQFYSSAPWEVIPPDAPLGIRCDALGIDDGAAVVVGQMGQSFGLSIFFSRDDAKRMVVAADEAQRRGTLEGVEGLPRCIMVSFGADIEASLRDEIAEHEWIVAGPSAYPRAALIESDLVSRHLTADEYAGVTAIMAAIAMLLDENSQAVIDAFEGGAGAVQECEIRVSGRPVEVQVIAAADLDDPGGPALDLKGFGAFSDDALDGAVSVYCEALVDALGVPWDTGDAELLCLLAQIAVDTFDAALLRLSPSELRQLLTKDIPREVPLSAESADRAFELLIRAFEFAAARFTDDARAAECLQMLTPAAREKFVAAFGDERKAKPRTKAKAKAKTKVKPKAKAKRKPAKTPKR